MCELLFCYLCIYTAKMHVYLFPPNCSDCIFCRQKLQSCKQLIQGSWNTLETGVPHVLYIVFYRQDLTMLHPKWSMSEMYHQMLLIQRCVYTCKHRIFVCVIWFCKLSGCRVSIILDMVQCTIMFVYFPIDRCYVINFNSCLLWGWHLGELKMYCSWNPRNLMNLPR